MLYTYYCLHLMSKVQLNTSNKMIYQSHWYMILFDMLDRMTHWKLQMSLVGNQGNACC